MVMVWFGNVYIFNKVEFPTVLILYMLLQKKSTKMPGGSTNVQDVHG
jgi:hypothetical protein